MKNQIIDTGIQSNTFLANTVIMSGLFKATDPDDDCIYKFTNKEMVDTGNNIFVVSGYYVDADTNNVVLEIGTYTKIAEDF